MCAFLAANCPTVFADNGDGTFTISGPGLAAVTFDTRRTTVTGGTVGPWVITDDSGNTATIPAPVAPSCATLSPLWTDQADEVTVPAGVRFLADDCTAYVPERIYEVGQSGPLVDHDPAIDPWAGAFMADPGNVTLTGVRVGSIVHTSGPLAWSLVRQTAAGATSVLQTGTLAAGQRFDPADYGPFPVAAGDLIGLMVTTSAPPPLSAQGYNLIGALRWTA
jgi:hypothetical protein